MKQFKGDYKMTRILTLVSGANWAYYKHLKLLLDNVSRINNIKNTKLNLVIYDLGLNEDESNELKNNHPEIIYQKFDFDNYPEHVSLEKYNGFNCSYAWKPIIFHEVCEKYGGLVHWMDTGTQYFSFKNLINLLENNYIYSPQSSGTIKKWTHETCMNNMDGYKYSNLPPRAGGIIGINYNIDWCRNLVNEWKNHALDKNCICPSGSNRSNHRQDQAVLSILFYRYYEIHKFEQVNHYIDLQPHVKPSEAHRRLNRIRYQIRRMPWPRILRTDGRRRIRFLSICRRLRNRLRR